MGYGIIHIWIMKTTCQPAIGSLWHISILDCHDRKVLGYVSHDEGVTWIGAKDELVRKQTADKENPHLALKVPPGCYKVNAEGEGKVSPTMVVVPSLAEVTIYLLAEL